MALDANMKTKALGKDEVMVLLDLISKHKVITTKATNATNNRLKEEAWKNVAHEFTASVGDFRRPDQLKLKWDNLKKAARKRSVLIQTNNLKTGGGKSYFPPDEVLDRVTAILGVRCTRLSADFVGDVESKIPLSQNEEEEVKVEDNDPLQVDLSSNKHMVLDEEVLVGGHGSHNELKTLAFNTTKNSLNKRRKLSEEVQRARRDKDLALAEYFKAKAEKVKLENIKLKLELVHLGYIE